MYLDFRPVVSGTIKANNSAHSDIQNGFGELAPIGTHDECLTGLLLVLKVYVHRSKSPGGYRDT